jgi:hypothetical protein
VTSLELSERSVCEMAKKKPQNRIPARSGAELSRNYRVSSRFKVIAADSFS